MKNKGYKFTHQYRNQKMYVSVFVEKQEIFATLAENRKDGQPQDVYTMSGIDAMARLASKLWQASEDHNLVCQQLNRASRTSGDIPAIFVNSILKALEHHEN